MTVRRITREEARRVAVRAQLLDLPRPTELVPMVEQLTLLQLDPTAAVAPNADLVAWTRLGSAYRPADLQQALEGDRSLFEHRAMIRPMADLGLFLAEMAAWPGPGKARDWLDANAGFRRYVLDLLRASGPLLSRDVEDRSDVPWPSSGWSNNRNVTQMLQLLAARGEVAIASRRGRQRVWDVAERVYPETPTVPLAQAQQIRAERRLRSLGVARPLLVDDAGEPVTIEGTTGEWRITPGAVGDPFTGRTGLLSPFDRLAYDRRRALELFDFDYRLEMYVPRAKRRWGYFALPVLHEDRLIGKADATADRKRGVLEVHAIHADVRFTRAIIAAVHAELDALAAWLGLTAETP